MIPKKIHYCWFGKNKMPKSLKKYIKSWRKFCPDYEIIKWDESNFDIKSSKFMLDAYNSKAWAFVSDYARLKIIYDNGGIYLDTDVELLKSLDELLTNKCFLPIQQDGQLIATGLGFGAEKNSVVIKKMLDEYENIIFDKDNKEKIACPIINTKSIKDYGIYNIEQITKLNNESVTIYPSKYFDPIAPGNSKNLLCDESFSIHHYSATWMNNKTVFKRKLINKIGQKRINRIKRFIKHD